MSYPGENYERELEHENEALTTLLDELTDELARLRAHIKELERAADINASKTAQRLAAAIRQLADEIDAEAHDVLTDEVG